MKEKCNNCIPTKIVLIIIVLCFQLAGCAGPRPILYPNNSSPIQADKDINECLKTSGQHASASNAGARIAKSTALGAGMGAASGAVGGAIRGSTSRGLTVGAAAGGTVGLIRGLFQSNEQPNHTYRNLVDRCLRDRGYETAGWD